MCQFTRIQRIPLNLSFMLQDFSQRTENICQWQLAAVPENYASGISLATYLDCLMKLRVLQLMDYSKAYDLQIPPTSFPMVLYNIWLPSKLQDIFKTYTKCFYNNLKLFNIIFIIFNILKLSTIVSLFSTLDQNSLTMQAFQQIEKIFNMCKNCSFEGVFNIELKLFFRVQNT